MNVADTQGNKSKNTKGTKGTKSKQVIPKQYKSAFTKWTGH